MALAGIALTSCGQTVGDLQPLTANEAATNDEGTTQEGRPAMVVKDVSVQPDDDLLYMGRLVIADSCGEFDEHTSALLHGFDSAPEFPGGIDSLRAYLNANLQYPQRAIEKCESGMVLAQMTIDSKGVVEYPWILYPDQCSENLNSAVLEAIGSMPNWRPAMKNGTPVRGTVRLPILFDLAAI